MKKTSPQPVCVPPEADRVFKLLEDSPQPLKLDAIMKLARLPRKSRKNLLACLRQMENEGKIVRPAPNAWTAQSRLQTLNGRFSAILSGGGFVRVSPDEELFIHPDNVGHAWHNDLVRIAVLPGEARGKNRQGKVLEILERALRNIPVQFEKRVGRTLLCRPADRRLHFDISVSFPPGEELPSGLRPGHLLLVCPKKRLAANLYDASLERVMGAENDVAVQEDLVKLNQNVPRAFPERALAEAARLPREPLEGDMAGREDMCNVPFITIDGADARDFDDAIEVSRVGDGWLLRVAIADVAHYVRPEAAQDGLDAEARRRGNSWYFPTSVEPMLPKALSNGLCSLAPLQKRLAMLAEIPFDKNGAPGKPRFAQIVMRSFGRLIYENVGEFFKSGCLETGGGNVVSDAPAVKAMLLEAHKLFKVLEAARKARGTLDFDLPEPAYSFGKNGEVTGVGVAGRGDANKLIEEFMIAANEAVARHLGQTPLPFLYRVHPAPEEAKMETLVKTLEATAVEHLPPAIMQKSAPDALQKILRSARGTPAEYVVNKLCLRAMAQARYQPENIGHFGLASPAYCHFTSPIRRYADLLVHRALKTALGGKPGALPDEEELWGIGNDLNSLERRAMECEREMGRRMGCLFLKNHIGEVFEATVSGITDFGIFVELSSLPLEGLIRLDDLAYDWFEADLQTQRLIGRKSGQVWKLGQPLRVRLDRIDMARLEARFLPEKAAGKQKRVRPAGEKPARGKRRAPKNAALPRHSGEKPPTREKRRAPKKAAEPRGGAEGRQRKHKAGR